MAPKKKISKEKWREYAQKRRERIRSDPVLAAIEAEKERKKYERKKAKKQVKLVKDMSVRELRAKRKLWRAKAKKAYEKKTQQSRLETHLRDSSPPLSEPDVPQPVDGRINSGRKKVRKERSKSAWMIKKLKEENESLRRQANKWRQKHWRLQNCSSDLNSPRKVASKLLKQGNREEIRKKLVFGEAIKRQLSENFKTLSGRRAKRRFGEILAGNGKVLRRYRLLSQMRGIISSKIFNNTQMLTNNSQLKHRMKKINAMVIKDVVTFFEEDEVSKLCPGKKDCVTKNKLKKQKRVLEGSMKNLFLKFLGKIDYKISYSSFCKLKPFWVVPHKVSSRDTCMCKVHANIELFMTALFRAKIIESASPKEFARHICCDVGNVECLQRKCQKCKRTEIPYLLFESETLVSFYKWQLKKETITDKKKNLHIVRHIVKERVNITAADAVEIFENDYKKYLFHEGNVIHQFRAIRALKAQMKDDEVLIHCDFSENYSMKYASEIQAFHFGGSRQQYTLHTSQIYFRRDVYSNLSTQSMCTLSESLDHGPAAVWAHLQPVFDFIKNVVPRLRVIHFLTDSPATQYRNKTIFYLLAQALEHFFSVSVATWNYMEAGHGKGAPDGVGGCLKRTADAIVAQGQDIDSFQRFVEVLKENVRKVDIHVIDGKEIESIKAILPSTIPPFRGTMQVHQVVYMKDYSQKLSMRSLSCFNCFNCNHHSLGYHDLSSEEPYENLKMSINCDIEPVTFLSMDNQEQDSSTAQELEGSAQPSTSAQSSYLYTPGTYVLATFKSEVKKNSLLNFRYVCCIEKINEDGTIVLNGLRCYQRLKNQFVVKENDCCVVNPADIVQVLPQPNFIMKNRKIINSFPFNIDINEQ